MGQRCVTRNFCVDGMRPLTLTQNCIIIPFCSVSSKWMKIFGWYLVGGCIWEQRCVARKNRVDTTFDLDPVALKPRFPSALYLLKNEVFWLIFGVRMYQGTKVCLVKELCRCDLWPWPCDLQTEIIFCSVSPKRMKILGWYFVWRCIRRQRCVTQKISIDATVDLNPVTLTPNCIIFPFRSIIPKRLMIFGWYLVWGCIGGQRCVVWKNCVDATFDLDPVTFKPKLPSALYLLNKWRFLVDIWCEDVSGDKGVSGERLVLMQLLTLTQWPWPKKLHNISLPLYNSYTRMYQETKVCHAKD
jgi:hypothetical protein